MTAADLVFAADTHEYRTPEGVLVPSVTRILRAVGVSVDFDALPNREAIALKRDLGTAAHMDCHAYDDDDLDWSTVDPRVLPYLKAWITFRENTGVRPLTRERIVYHPALGYCGTMDGIFQRPDGSKVLIELKVGDPDDAAAHLQTAAYEAAYMAEHPSDTINARWAVKLSPELLVPYRIYILDGWRDFDVFAACVAVFNAQPARRRAGR